MTWSATVLLCLDILDDERLVEDFSEWLRTRAPRRQLPTSTGVGSLRPLHDKVDAWGGWRPPEARLWGGVTGDADVGAVVERFAATPWRHPESAQIMIQDGGEATFRVWVIRDGSPVELTP